MNFFQKGLASLSLFLACSSAHAFDILDEKVSYAENKFFTTGAGFGFIGFAQEQGIQGDPGFSLRVNVGHHFNEYLYGEIYYQWAAFRFDSPDPIAPSNFLKTRSYMNQEVLRLLVTYPAVLAQPYVSVGFGGYNFMPSDDSALSFPIDMVFPLSAGIRSYLFENWVSLDLEFTYNILLGENQSKDTLELLALEKVSFDSYFFTGSFTFHFF